MLLRVNSVRFNTQDVVSYMFHPSLWVGAGFSEMVRYVVALFIHLHLRTDVYCEFAEVGTLLLFYVASGLFFVTAALACLIDIVVFFLADLLFVSLVFFRSRRPCTSPGFAGLPPALLGTRRASCSPLGVPRGMAMAALAIAACLPKFARFLSVRSCVGVF